MICNALAQVAPQPTTPKPATAQPATPPTVASAIVSAEQNLFGWITELERLSTTTVQGYTRIDIQKVVAACHSVEQWSIEVTRLVDPQQPELTLKQLRFLLLSKQRVDGLLENLLALRVKFADYRGTAANDQRNALINYLQVTSTVTDLAGRIRYSQRDALEVLVNSLLSQPTQFNQALDQLLAARSSSGAVVLTDLLVEPPLTGPAKDLLNAGVRQRICQLIASAGSVELLPDLVQVLKSSEQPAAVRLAAAQAIMELGLPQQVRPGSDASQSLPAITPATMYEQLQRIPTDQLSAAQLTERKALNQTLAQRMRQGMTSSSFRFGRFELQAGDWLLMRNPSPYNRCTDLSPGLFTHVGVIASETGVDGVNRMVVVDLPERGQTIPATNVEIYLERTLNYMFLRHPDPKVATQLGQAAASCIGNPCEFDLNFRTDRVKALAGKSLRGAKVHTYCAGFLLLCAQQTGLPRSEFFPLIENPPPGRMRENFGQLGLSFGQDFISPTGALFAPKLQLIGRRDPLYDPRREVEEAIFDHFAIRCQTSKLVQSPDAVQALRTKLAEAAKSNTLLAQALATAANVPAEADLLSAAKAAAVVETLDDIAFGHSAKYLSARTAIIEGPQPPTVPERTAEQVRELVALRQTHQELASRWDQKKLPPRQLRIELVNYYSAAGKRELDARFFPEAVPLTTAPAIKQGTQPNSTGSNLGTPAVTKNPPAKLQPTNPTMKTVPGRPLRPGQTP